MASSRTLRLLAAVLAVLTIGLAHVSTARYPFPFPPLWVSLSSPVTRLSDFGGIAMGFRKLTADLAWLQNLIYYGTREEGTDAEVAENGGGQYPLLLAYCQRVVQIDPNFKYVYYYGASALGWNLGRLDEAETFLKEGIKAHPKEWRFQQFLAGLAYQKNHNINSLIDFLKVFTEEQDCPNILRSILANIYKKQHRYMEALHVWTMVYDTHDPYYEKLSLVRIEEIAKEAHIGGKMGLSTH